MPTISDPIQIGPYLHHAHDTFVQIGGTDAVVHQVVVDSWRRSLGSGLDPEY